MEVSFGLCIPTYLSRPEWAVSGPNLSRMVITGLSIIFHSLRALSFFWRKMLSCCFISQTWKSSKKKKDNLDISELCLSSLKHESYPRCLHTSQHLRSSLMHGYSRGARCICFPTPSKNKLNRSSADQSTFFTATIHVRSWADARLKAGLSIVFLPFSLHSYRPGHSAVLLLLT